MSQGEFRSRSELGAGLHFGNFLRGEDAAVQKDLQLAPGG